jgi:hypothetical protein
VCRPSLQPKLDKKIETLRDRIKKKEVQIADKVCGVWVDGLRLLYILGIKMEPDLLILYELGSHYTMK